jgi:hypothetical protein
MKNVFFVLVFLTICGCTYHSQSKDPITPVTYKATSCRSPESVGKLRRLVLMPVEIRSYKGRYVSVKDQEAAAQSYEDACAHFLTEQKGYEVVVVRDTDGKWRSGLLTNSGHENIQDLYQKWHKEKGEKHTRSVIQQIGGALNVDGVLVIRIKERKPWGVTKGLMNIALMNIPLYHNIASPNTGAWIYETSTGRLVWRQERSTFVDKTTSATTLVILFADLENAVPLQLIK